MWRHFAFKVAGVENALDDTSEKGLAVETGVLLRNLSNVFSEQWVVVSDHEVVECVVHGLFKRVGLLTKERWPNDSGDKVKHVCVGEKTSGGV